MRTYAGDITELKPNQWVMAPTNIQGRHGAGFALWCYRNAGLEYKVSHGPSGRCFAVYTKDLRKKDHPSVSRVQITFQLTLMYGFAKLNKDVEILVPYKAGTTLLSGYTTEQMAEMFAMVKPIPDNVIFEEGFAELIKKHLK